MELHQNFIQSFVGNESQSPEMGKIPFFSRHTVLSSINIHLIAVTAADLIVTLGKSLSSCMGFFHRLQCQLSPSTSLCLLKALICITILNR